MQFLILTQADRSDPTSKAAQTSAARSYLATQRHARRRNLKALKQYQQQCNSSESPGDILSAAAFVLLQSPARPLVYNPFCLPLNITGQERGALHFWLTTGRQVILGTSELSQCCPALDLARSLMPVCHVYVLAHIVLGEYLLSRMKGVPVRYHYYSRTAQMYKAINKLLTDPEISTGHKLWAFIQAAMVEHIVERTDLQRIHVRALDALVDSSGGLSKYTESATDDIFLQISSRLYANQFARIAVLPTDRYHLKALVARFMLCMTGINAWMCSLRSSWTPQCETRTPKLLLAYLSGMAQKAADSSMLFCPLSICLTLVEASSTIEKALQFLLRVEELMFDTPTAQPPNSREAKELHPVTTAYIISSARSEMFPEIREFHISETMLNAHKMFALLSERSKIEVISWLVDCISILSLLRNDSKSVWSMYTDFGSGRLGLLEKEIETSWGNLKQTSSQQSS